ncbi:F5/8 type C domain containing protein [Tritrichomonas foetus]|uniref:F5/8 type C domain containing protein n=1 Tax=Tritrichomonas foetus TaxID=1144522 RepID=A0A1J4L0Q0_9EUKA|nr:F5/8 type C domain containing protein [Tritrichomonas foetus]|eukprot:OHT15445.1 F5/8 type C domain containing protein [Tritrichomonas foetus]
MTQVFSPTPLRPDDFIFIYNEQEVKISKYQFALYSPKFRRIPEFFATTQMEIHDDPPFPVFCQFLRAAQGAEVNVTVNNALDFLHFCDIWEVDTVAAEVKKVLNENKDIEMTIQKILDAKESDSIVSLEEIIASNFDSALQMTSLTEFPIESLYRIVNNPRCEIKKTHRYYRFVKQMLNRVGQSASLLASKVDITRLSTDQAYEFLTHPKLIKSYLGDSLADAMINLIHDNNRLVNQLNENRVLLNDITKRIENLEYNSYERNDPSESIRLLNKKISHLESKIGSSGGNLEINSNELNSKIKHTESKIEKLCNDTIEAVNQLFNEVESRAHKDLRKTNKIVNGLTKKSSILETNVSSIRNFNADLKNSLAALLRKTLENEQMLKSAKAALPDDKNLLSVQTLTIQYNGQPYNGIISKLTELAEGNIHVKGITTISASSSDHNEAYQIADFKWEDCFFTEDRANSWVMFDFQNKKVHLSNYTIKSHKYPAGTCHLKSWVIEGSNNINNGWIEIDKRVTPVLNGANKFQTFPAGKTTENFRYLRLRQIGQNCRGDNILALTNIEFFGTIFFLE